MINYIIKVYCFFNFKLLRAPLRALFTLYLDLKFKLFPKNFTLKKSKINNQIIVSVTSFPDRINKLHLVIESILNQSIRPKYIYLWLSKNQFNCINELPKEIINLQKFGLRIELFEEDLRSHKKYYYALKYFPDKTIITIDDDYVYNPCLIEGLIDLNEKHINSVCCNIAHNILRKKLNILPYTDWSSVKISQESKKIIPIGAGGVLYPPYILHNEVLNKKVFQDICPLADDIWLNAMTLLNNKTIIKTEKEIKNFPIFYFKTFSLNNENVNQGKNDSQLYKVREYLSKKFSDPYIHLFNE